MTDSIADIMGKKKYEKPDEIETIKNYMQDKFQSTCEVAVKDRQIIIAVSSAALAGTLRTHLHELQELCQTKKRLVIQIN